MQSSYYAANRKFFRVFGYFGLVTVTLRNFPESFGSFWEFWGSLFKVNSFELYNFEQSTGYRLEFICSISTSNKNRIWLKRFPHFSIEIEIEYDPRDFLPNNTHPRLENNSLGAFNFVDVPHILRDNPTYVRDNILLIF